MKEIPEIKLAMVGTTFEACKLIGFNFADETVGKRSKSGGQPDISALAQTSAFPACTKEMTFYSQIDPVGDDACLADIGMACVFDCFETESFIQ